MAARTKTKGNGPKGSVVRVERRPDGVAVLWLDDPAESVNTLSADLSSDLSRALTEVDTDASVKALVFASGKKDFIVGANLHMLSGVRTAAEATELSRAGQEGMDRIEAFPKPIVAAIHGSCLGGGLEMAMACRERVATDDPRTKLGQPEVQLGLLPGAGGTQRLPRLVGVQQALDLMLTGKHVSARKAKKLGLVDEVVSEPILVDVAAERALRLAAAPEKKKEKPVDRLKHFFDREELTERALADNPVGRKVLFDQARKQLRKKTRGNYPAPEKILEVVKVGLAQGFDRGLEAEREAFGELVVSPEAAQLMGIFFATTALKKDRGVDDPSTEPRPVHKVGVLGGGLMGGGIAYVTAATGVPVRLKDKDDAGVLHGLEYVRRILDERVERRRVDRIVADWQMTFVTGTTDYSGFGDCDVVIEAVFEDLDLKHRVLRETEEACREDAIFASNTSSIPITRIAETSKHPETVIGMHYFSPVHKMPLLEVIVTGETAPWVTATCVELGKRQGKTVIVVRDGVGFYTSRILAPYMNEAAHVLAEGVPVEEIDRALLDWGFPVGPIKLTDEVGIDVGAKVGKIMVDAFGDRMQAPEGLSKLLEDERFGRKNQRGFYLYGGKKGEVDESVYELLGVTPATEMPAEEIAERCALMMVNEAALCFQEGILRSARDGDVGAVFGLGFPPFRGGPFRWVDAVGAKNVVRMLGRYRERHGKRFEPAPLLTAMARGGLTFHGERAVRPGEIPRVEAGAAARP